MLQPHNVDRVESLFALAEEVAADHLYFERVIPFEPAVRLEPAAARLAAADIASLAGYDEAVMSSTGEVRPCCVLHRVLGSVRIVPFREIWFGAEYERLRRNLLHGVWEDQCRRCWMHGSLVE